MRHSYYPSELNVRREAEALRDDGLDVTVLCLRGEDEPSREVVDGVAVHRMPVGHRRGAILRYVVEYNLFFLFATFWLTWKHLRARFVVVQVNTMPDYLVLVALPARLLGARVVLHVHEPMPELFATLFPGRRFAAIRYAIRISERLSVWFADAVLTVTADMKRRLVERGANSEEITVILNVPDERMIHRGAASPDVEPAGVQGTTAPAAPYVVTHGAIEERYGPDLIVHAMAQLKDDLPELEFHLLGAGDYVDEVLQLVDELGLADRVSYLGFVPFEEMLREVRNARVGIVPMRSNPYSNLVHTNKMYEYIEFGRPVIASRLDSVASYFSDDELTYFEPGDATDLARAIRSLILDPQLAAAKAEAARRQYEGLRWEHEREKYLGVHRALRSRSAKQVR